MDRRRRSLPGASLATLLFAGLALGCGAEAPPRAAETPATETTASADALAPGPTSSAAGHGLTVHDGRVTLNVHATPRLPLMRRLARQLAFELQPGDLADEPISVSVADAEPQDVLPMLLPDRSYRADWRHDPVENRHFLARLVVAPRGEALPSVAAPATAGGFDLAKASRRELQAEGQIPTPLFPKPEPDELLPEDATPEERLAWFEQRLEHADPDERIDAVERIAPMGRGTGLLIEALELDPNPRVRAAAAEQLEDVDEIQGVDALVRALEDPDKRVVLAALDALELTDDESVADHIRPLLEHRDPEVREAAEDAIDFITF